MKIKTFLSISIVVLALITTTGIISPLEAYVSVKGYYKSNGTYVRPHVRSTPNALRYDNYSYSGGNRYNSSYYSPNRSYSTDWYTPSYRTDPNYYSGLNLYRSGY